MFATRVIQNWQRSLGAIKGTKHARGGQPD